MMHMDTIARSKHGGIYKENAQVYYNHYILVKHLNVVTKCCLNWIYFSMVSSIVVLGTHI